MAAGLMTMLHRGEIRQYRFKAPDKRRPVVILTRQEVLPLLRTAMVAPITSTIRGLPSEVAVGADEGLAHDSVVNPDPVQTVEQRLLRRYVGSLSEAKMRQVCRALALATGCAWGSRRGRHALPPGGSITSGISCLEDRPSVLRHHS